MPGGTFIRAGVEDYGPYKWAEVEDQLKEFDRTTSRILDRFKKGVGRGDDEYLDSILFVQSLDVSEVEKASNLTYRGTAFGRWFRYSTPERARKDLTDAFAGFQKGMSLFLQVDWDPEPRQWLKDVRSWVKSIREIRKAVNLYLRGPYGPAPQRFNFDGLSVRNKDRLSDWACRRMLDAVSYAKALFERRGLKDMFQLGVDKVVLAPRSKTYGASAHGEYDSWAEEIRFFALSFQMKKGRLYKDWVEEIFVHEFGHHIHLTYITKEAKAFWDSTWNPVKDAEDQQEKDLKLSPKERQRWFDMLMEAKGDAVAVGRKLDGVQRLKYLAWLRFAGLIGERSKQVRINAKGKDDLKVTFDPDERSWMFKHHLHNIGLWDGTPEDLAQLKKDGHFQSTFEKWFDSKMRRFRLNDHWKDHNVPLSTTDEKVEDIAGLIKEVGQERRQKAVEQVSEIWGTPTDYGRTNLMEDFAESFVQYMVSPESMPENALYRMKRTLWLSGFGNKPVQRLATKDKAEKEDEHADDQVKKEPKKKPPRYDRRNKRIKVEDPDMDDDSGGAESDQDLSLNYKGKSARLVARRWLRTAAEPRKEGEVWRTDRGWSGKNEKGDTENFQGEDAKSQATSWAKGKDALPSDDELPSEPSEEREPKEEGGDQKEEESKDQGISVAGIKIENKPRSEEEYRQRSMDTMAQYRKKPMEERRAFIGEVSDALKKIEKAKDPEKYKHVKEELESILDGMVLAQAVHGEHLVDTEGKPVRPKQSPEMMALIQTMDKSNEGDISTFLMPASDFHGPKGRAAISSALNDMEPENLATMLEGSPVYSPLAEVIKDPNIDPAKRAQFSKFLQDQVVDSITVHWPYGQAAKKQAVSEGMEEEAAEEALENVIEAADGADEAAQEAMKMYRECVMEGMSPEECKRRSNAFRMRRMKQLMDSAEDAFGPQDPTDPAVAKVKDAVENNDPSAVEVKYVKEDPSREKVSFKAL